MAKTNEIPTELQPNVRDYLYDLERALFGDRSRPVAPEAESGHAQAQSRPKDTQEGEASSSAGDSPSDTANEGEGDDAGASRRRPWWRPSA